MIFKEDGNNDLYEKIDVSTERKQQIIDACLKENEQRTPQIDNELDLRRNINMKNDKDGYAILKKVAVAAVSVGLSGAVIAGVVIYNGGKNNGKNVGANKDTEVSSEMITKYTNDDNKSTDEQKKSYKIRNLKTMKMDKDEDSNYYKVKDHSINEKEYLIGDYMIKEDVFGGISHCYVKGKDDDEYDYEMIPDLEYVDDSLYTNGKYFYYASEYLYKYNMETKERTYYDLYGVLNIDITKLGYQTVIDSIKDNNLYFSTIIEDYNRENRKCSFYIFNLTNNKLDCLSANRGCVLFDDNYVVTARYIDPGSQDKPDQAWYIEKINGDKLEEVKSLGKYVSVIEEQSSKNNKIYFESYEGLENSKITITSFDKNTCEIKEECVLRSTDFPKGTKSMCMEEINDDYGIVRFVPIGKLIRYKYVFATKEMELLSEEEIK